MPALCHFRVLKRSFYVYLHLETYTLSKTNFLAMFRELFQKVQKSLAVLALRKAAANDVCLEELEVETAIPDHCKERFFTVFVDKGEEKFRLFFHKILQKGHAILAAKKPALNGEEFEVTTVLPDDIKERKVEELVRLLIQKMQKRLAILVPKKSAFDDDVVCFEELDVTTVVPNDVKEGCFTVFAVKGEETQRFVIELAYLSDPAFMRLLDDAEAEYGFEQNGVLAVPCRPEELRQILEE